MQLHEAGSPAAVVCGVGTAGFVVVQKIVRVRIIPQLSQPVFQIHHLQEGDIGTVPNAVNILQGLGHGTQHRHGVGDEISVKAPLIRDGSRLGGRYSADGIAGDGGNPRRLNRNIPVDVVDCGDFIIFKDIGLVAVVDKAHRHL